MRIEKERLALQLTKSNKWKKISHRNLGDRYEDCRRTILEIHGNGDQSIAIVWQLWCNMKSHIKLMVVKN